ETSFDLLDDLDCAPSVVSVTAHSDYATQAFDVQAVDYLLKPVSPDRLAQTLSRLKPRGPTYLTTRNKTGVRLVKTDELTFAQAQGDYVRLCSADHGDELLHITMKRL